MNDYELVALVAAQLRASAAEGDYWAATIDEAVLDAVQIVKASKLAVAQAAGLSEGMEFFGYERIPAAQRTPSTSVPE